MFRKFVYNFQQWMIGRNGMDALNICLLVLYLILAFFSSISGGFMGKYIWNSLALFSIIICFFRMFSKNRSQRYQENLKFLNIWNKVKNKVSIFIRQMKEYETHRFFTCKSCGQVIRVPKGKNKICITCPKCKNEFIKKT